MPIPKGLKQATAVGADAITFKDQQQSGSVYRVIGFLEVKKDLVGWDLVDDSQLLKQFRLDNGRASALFGSEAVQSTMVTDITTDSVLYGRRNQFPDDIE